MSELPPGHPRRTQALESVLRSIFEVEESRMKITEDTLARLDLAMLDVTVCWDDFNNDVDTWLGYTREGPRTPEDHQEYRDAYEAIAANVPRLVATLPRLIDVLSDIVGVTQSDYLTEIRAALVSRMSSSPDASGPAPSS